MSEQGKAVGDEMRDFTQTRAYRALQAIIMTFPRPVFQLENDMILLILRGSFWLSGERIDSAGGRERWQK